MKKTVSLLCILVLIVTCFAACGKKEEHAPVEGNTLRFTNLVEDMKALDGKTVNITGYMCEDLSTKSGIIYLMKSPCREKAFGEDNSAQLADTLAVHLTDKGGAEFTEKLITVEGTLIFEEYTDIRGYTYSYYIKDAAYTVADADKLDGKAKEWQQLTDSGVTEEMNRMYEYLYFICNWSSMTAVVNGESKYTDPYMALYNIENEGAIFYYGCEEGYFSSLKEKIESLDGDFASLISNVEKAKSLSDKALSALKNGEYTLASDGSGMYILNKGEEIKNEYNSLYSEYNDWLQGWSI